MKTSTQCPECGEAISVASIFRQFTLPTHIKCRHCKSRLRVEMRGRRLFLGIEIAMYAVIAALIVAAVLAPRSTLPWIVVGILIYLGIEVGAALLYVNHGQFIPREPGRK